MSGAGAKRPPPEQEAGAQPTAKEPRRMDYLLLLHPDTCEPHLRHITEVLRAEQEPTLTADRQHCVREALRIVQEEVRIAEKEVTRAADPSSRARPDYGRPLTPTAKAALGYLVKVGEKCPNVVTVADRFAPVVVEAALRTARAAAAEAPELLAAEAELLKRLLSTRSAMQAPLLAALEGALRAAAADPTGADASAAFELLRSQLAEILTGLPEQCTATAAAARLGHLLRLIADYAPLLLGDPRPPAATLWAADLGALRHNLTRLSVALGIEGDVGHKWRLAANVSELIRRFDQSPAGEPPEALQAEPGMQVLRQEPKDAERAPDTQALLASLTEPVGKAVEAAFGACSTAFKAVNQAAKATPALRPTAQLLQFVTQGLGNIPDMVKATKTGTASLLEMELKLAQTAYCARSIGMQAETLMEQLQLPFQDADGLRRMATSMAADAASLFLGLSFARDYALKLDGLLLLAGASLRGLAHTLNEVMPSVSDLGAAGFTNQAERIDRNTADAVKAFDELVHLGGPAVAAAILEAEKAGELAKAAAAMGGARQVKMAEELAAAARGANYVSMINRLVDAPAGIWRVVLHNAGLSDLFAAAVVMRSFGLHLGSTERAHMPGTLKALSRMRQALLGGGQLEALTVATGQLAAAAASAPLARNVSSEMAAKVNNLMAQISAGWMVRLSALEELLVGGCLLTVEDQAELGRTTARLGELAAHLAADDRQAQTVLLLAKNNNGELPPHLLALEHQLFLRLLWPTSNLPRLERLQLAERTCQFVQQMRAAAPRGEDDLTTALGNLALGESADLPDVAEIVKPSSVGAAFNLSARIWAAATANTKQAAKVLLPVLRGL